MAYEAMWYKSHLPEEIIDPMMEHLWDSDNFIDSETKSGLKLDIRDSQHQWIPDSHWVCGLLWHYVTLANNTNFGYDITQFDHNAIQYTRYEAGQYYGWHKDDGVASIDPNDRTKQIRKLSVVVQLSSHEDYTGGEFQMMEDVNRTFFAPKQKGTIIIFDSRLPHRAKKVLTGERRSLVAWVTGPQWR